MGFIRKYKNISIHLIIITGIILFAVFAPDTILHGYDAEQVRTVLLLLIAIYLWTISKIPTGAAGILLLLLIILFDLTDTAEQAMAGFMTSALYFILILSILSDVLIKTEADKLISARLLQLKNISPKRIVLFLPILMSLLPIFMPSAFARLKTILPFVESLNNAFDFSDKSVFKKYAMYVLGFVNQNSTMIVYTGGGYPILAAQLLSDYDILNIGWLGWFIIVAPPMWCALLINSMFAWYYLKFSYPSESESDFNGSKQQIKHDYHEYKPSKSFWFVIVTFILMISAWVLTNPENVPVLLPPMVLLVLYALPGIGLITNKDIRSFPWENFLMIGAALSVGIIMDENGTARLIAEQLMNIVPENADMFASIVIITCIIFLFRMMFIVPTSAVIVIFPVMVSYADIAGIPPVVVAFIVIMIIGGTNILPIHSPTLFFAFKEGVLTKKDHYVMAALSSSTFIIVAILAASSYWMLWA